jgi:hypothetical protein
MLPAWQQRAIEWRHAWPVRFAHHPLCARHRHETWKLGRLYLCRGCVALAAGITAGTTAVVGFGGPWFAAVAAVLTPIVLAGSWPALYARLPRAIRDALRVLLGLWLTIGAATVASAWPWLWPVVPAVALAWWAYRRQRQRVMARRCDGCPELGKGVCSGYAEHARAMRAIADDIEARMVLSGVQGFGDPQASASTAFPQNQAETR